MSQQEEAKFDGVLMSVMQQQKGSIDGFFNTVFGFLRRNTDFFSNQKKAEQAITSTCKKNFDQYTADQQKKQEEEKQKKEREEKKKAEAAKKAAQSSAKVSAPVQQKVEEAPKVEQPVVSGQTPEKKEDKDEPPPKGNGGKTDKYVWTQTLQQLQMFVPVPEGTKAKMMNVNIAFDSLLVQIKGQQAIINGKFYDKISTDDSTWTLQDGQLQGVKCKYIRLTIGKWKNQNSWWSTPIKGDPQINTQKINPEPSKLDDLQGETKATVSKMMFDMQQKQKGLPTSDELQKQQKLKEFMKAHPEMDFSKCKFN